MGDYCCAIRCMTICRRRDRFQGVKVQVRIFDSAPGSAIAFLHSPADSFHGVEHTPTGGAHVPLPSRRHRQGYHAHRGCRRDVQCHLASPRTPPGCAEIKRASDPGVPLGQKAASLYPRLISSLPSGVRRLASRRDARELARGKGRAVHRPTPLDSEPINAQRIPEGCEESSS
jgi:hypothetical protein